jgi:hypothetical protein
VSPIEYVSKTCLDEASTSGRPKVEFKVRLFPLAQFRASDQTDVDEYYTIRWFRNKVEQKKGANSLVIRVSYRPTDYWEVLVEFHTSEVRQPEHYMSERMYLEWPELCSA